MIAILIILAWSLTIASGIVIITGVAISFASLSVIDQVTGGGSKNILAKLFTFFTKQPYTTFAGDNSPLLLNANSINNLTWTTIFTAIVMVLFGISLIGVAVFELTRVKKRQKISKPFVRVYLLSLVVLFLLFAQFYLVITAVLLFAAVILMEFGLLDSEAVNNYAEERNLIAIYKEEKKFEKEVTKEGKLIGNVDSTETNQKKYHVVDENLNTTDNAALPDNSNIKNEIAFRKWTDKKEKIEFKIDEFIKNKDKLKSSKVEKLVLKLNKEIQTVNIQAFKLNIPIEYQIKYVDLETLKEEQNKINVIEENDKELNLAIETNQQVVLTDNAEFNDRTNIIELEEQQEPEVEKFIEYPKESIKELEDVRTDNQKTEEILLEKQSGHEDIQIAKKTELYNDFNFEQKDLSNKILESDFSNLESIEEVQDNIEDQIEELVEKQSEVKPENSNEEKLLTIEEVTVQEDILKIEKRLSNLENLINELVSSNQKEEIYSDFEKISEKLETINQAILKINNNSNPINVIDSITRRYKYNQNNS